MKNPTAITLSFLWASLFGTALAAAGTGGVRDSGDFFSEAAIKEATRTISDIETKFKKDLVVETFLDIPEETKRGVDLSDKRALNKMFGQWTVKEAIAMRGEGTTTTAVLIRLDIRDKTPTTQEQVATSAMTLAGVTGVAVTGVAVMAVISKLCVCCRLSLRERRR